MSSATYSLRAATDGLSDDEVMRAKGQLRGSTVLDAEDPNSRMSRLGDAEILTGTLQSMDDILEKIDNVTTEEVAAIASDLLNQQQTITVVGPYEPDRTFGSED